MKLRKTKKGFTIVELVIVIGVIGILTGILIPTFVNVTQKAEEAALKSNLANAYSAYVADAADGKVESAEKVFKAENNDAVDYTVAGSTYYIDLVKQESVVLVDAKDNNKQFKFSNEAWQQLTTGNITTTEVQKMVVYDNSSYSKYDSTDTNNNNHYFKVQYGNYLVYSADNRAAKSNA